MFSRNYSMSNLFILWVRLIAVFKNISLFRCRKWKAFHFNHQNQSSVHWLLFLRIFFEFIKYIPGFCGKSVNFVAIAFARFDYYAAFVSIFLRASKSTGNFWIPIWSNWTYFEFISNEIVNLIWTLLAFQASTECYK